MKLTFPGDSSPFKASRSVLAQPSTSETNVTIPGINSFLHKI